MPFRIWPCLVWRRFYIFPSWPILDSRDCCHPFPAKELRPICPSLNPHKSSSFRNKELLSWGALQFHWSAGLEIARYLLSANNLIWYIDVCIYRPIPFLAKSPCQASRLEMGPVGGIFTWASSQDSASEGRNSPPGPSAGQIHTGDKVKKLTHTQIVLNESRLCHLCRLQARKVY